MIENELIQVRHPNTGLISTALVLKSWDGMLANGKKVLLVDCHGNYTCNRIHLVSESNTKNIFEMWEGDTK